MTALDHLLTTFNSAAIYNPTISLSRACSCMNQVMVRLSYTEVSLGLDFILSAEQAIKSMPMLTLVDGESGYPEREFKRCLAAETSA